MSDFSLSNYLPYFGSNSNAPAAGMPGSSVAPVYAEPLNAPGTPGATSQIGGGIFGTNTDKGFATELGPNIGTGQLALSGLRSLGNLWTGMQALNLAKSQLAFQKGFANANLSNQIQTFNTALADRARARGFTEGQPQSQIDQYVAQNRLTPRTV